jgi:hypothetical protein
MIPKAQLAKLAELYDQYQYSLQPLSAAELPPRGRSENCFPTCIPPMRLTFLSMSFGVEL